MAFYIGNNIVIDNSSNANVGVITATQTRLITSSERITTSNTNTVHLVYNSASSSNVGYALSPTNPVTLEVSGIPTSTDFNNFSISFKVIINSTGIARSCSNVVLNGTNLPIYWDGGSYQQALGGRDVSDGHAVYKFDAINVTGSASTITNFSIFGSLVDFYPDEGVEKHYSIMPDKTSVNEGGSVTFTIMASNVPSATPLYWALETASTVLNGSDFTDGEVGGTVMFMNGMATVTRTLRADNITEGLEAFALTLRTGSTSGPVVAVSPMVTVGDTSLAAVPDYMLMPNRTRLSERGTVSINVTTDNVPNGTTLYWSTLNVLGIVTAADFTDDSLTGSVVINSGIGTITRTLKDSIIVDGNESFAIQLRTDSVTGTIQETSQAITIVKDDFATPVQNETPLYSIMPVHNNVSNVVEGNTLLFNILTTNVPNGTTLYWTTDSTGGTINSSDFSDGQLSGSVVVNNSCATISRTLSADGITEGVESFVLRLRTSSISGTIVASSATVNVSDYVAPSPLYFITPSDSTVNEGDFVNFKVSTSEVPNGTTLYWTTAYSSGVVNAADFSDGVTSGTVEIQNGIGLIHRTLASDFLSEGTESFTIQLRTVSTSGSIVATSSPVRVNDTSPVTPSYSATCTQTTVSEGGLVFINIQTTNVPTGTELYWTTNPVSGTILASDFVDNQLSGTVIVSGGGATILRHLSNDLVLEGDESFQIQVRAQVLGANVATSPTITIKDLGAPPTPGYMIMPDSTVVTEGGSIHLSVNTMNVPDGTILNWTTHSTQGVIDPSDFTDGTTTGYVVIRNGAASIQRTLRQDAITEGTERFEIRLRTDGYSGTVVATSPIITVLDFVPPTPEYSIVPSASNVNEGNSVTFMVSASHVRNGTVLHWTSVLGSGASGPDFTDGVTSGSVIIFNGMATITRSLVNDALTEGVETFALQLRTGSSGGTVVATSPTVTIGDTSPTLIPVHSINCNTTSVTEGATVSFNVFTTNVANGTTLYWTTTGAVNSADFTDNSLSGSVTINGGMATITRTLVQDLLLEGVETFQLQLRTGSTLGTIVATSSAVAVNDHIPAPVHACSASPLTVNEGQSVTFNITTTNVPSGTRFFYFVQSAKTDATDFVDSPSGSVVVYNGTASVTLRIREDFMTEGTETFQLQLRPVGANGETGDVVVTSPVVTILDTSTTPVPIPYHGIVADSTSIKVREGSTVKFTVTEVNNTVSPKNLYWTTIGRVDSRDFTDGVTQGVVTLVDGKGVISRSIKLDFLPERTENFQILLRDGSTSGAILATSPLVSIINVPLPRFCRLVTQAAPWSRSITVGTPVTLTITVSHDRTTLGGSYRVRPVSNPGGHLCLVDGQSAITVNINDGRTIQHVLSVTPRSAGYHTGTFEIEQVDGTGTVHVPWSIIVTDPVTFPAVPPHPAPRPPIHPPIFPPSPPPIHRPVPPPTHPRPVPVSRPHPRPVPPPAHPIPPRFPTFSPPFPPRFCPDPNTLILLADGSQKRAGDLRIGDLLRTQHEDTLVWGDHAVTHVETVSADKIALIFDHVEFICSTSHKFYVEGKGWTEVNQMEIGDSVIGVDGSHKLLEVKEAPYGEVVTIQVEDAHTYISEGLLSHNKLIFPPSFPVPPSRPPSFPSHPRFRR